MVANGTGAGAGQKRHYSNPFDAKACKTLGSTGKKYYDITGSWVDRWTGRMMGRVDGRKICTFAVCVCVCVCVCLIAKRWATPVCLSCPTPSVCCSSRLCGTAMDSGRWSIGSNRCVCVLSLRYVVCGIVCVCSIQEKDVETILDWKKSSAQQKEIPFMPARVLLQDFT